MRWQRRAATRIVYIMSVDRHVRQRLFETRHFHGLTPPRMLGPGIIAGTHDGPAYTEGIGVGKPS